jgi:release factor glutamine methyltransferase
MTTRNDSGHGRRPKHPSTPPANAEKAQVRLAQTPPQDAQDDWTIGRLLNWTIDFLARKNAETPRLDAEVLLAHVLGCLRVQLYTRFGDVVSTTERGAFRDLVKRRAEGCPVAYLVGRKEFYSLPLAVSPSVLIPRPDTETLVAEFLTRFKDIEHPRCVDVGTGSGAIALACVSHHPTATFLATDISADALGIARANAQKLGLAKRIAFVQGDLLDPLRGQAPVSAILSNPPYIPTEVISTLDAGVRDHEPHTALDGGPDGLRVVARLIKDAPSLLEPGGQLILEIGTAQEHPVRALIEAELSLELTPTLRDAANHPRVIRAVRR